VMIFKLEETYCRWWFPSQQGLCAHRKPIISWGIGFVDKFQVGSVSIFGDAYRVNRDWTQRQI
jgi:hypothetical protein